MSKFTINPYVSEWGGVRVWVFDDPAKGLINEGLVSGTDKVLDNLASFFPDGEKGFSITFGDEPFEGHQMAFKWDKEDTGEDLADGVVGNWYVDEASGQRSWLCPALFKYFDKAPEYIYLKAEALKGTLERGTGKVVIQGKA